MNLLILLVIVIVSAILTVQNSQVVPLYFLGNSAKTAILTLTLPLGVWVLLFTLAGLLTSLILRGFLRSPRPTAPQREFNPKPNAPQRKSVSSKRAPVFATESNTSSSDWTTPESDDWLDREAVENWFDEEDVAPPVTVGTQKETVDSVRDRPNPVPEQDWQSDLRREAIKSEPEIPPEEEDWESKDIYDQPSFEKQRKVQAIRPDREDREAELRQLEREQYREEDLRQLEWEQQREENLRRLDWERQQQQKAQGLAREPETRRFEGERLQGEPFERESRREIAKPRSERQRPDPTPATEGISIFPTRSNFEVPQTPKTSTQEGTIYTYTYKEPRDRKKASPPKPQPEVQSEPRQIAEEKPNDVFDVNYRLITPPRSPDENLPDDDDEEWL